MRKTLLIILITFINVVGCTKDNNDINLESEHNGVESLIIKPRLELTIEALGGTVEDYPFLQGEVSTLYGATYTGYVAPDYGNGNTSITATFLSSNKEGYISYNGEQFNVGESFSVLEFFNDSHSVTTSDFYYVGKEEGLHEVQFKFVSNRGTTIIRDDSFFFK